VVLRGAVTALPNTSRDGRTDFIQWHVIRQSYSRENSSYEILTYLLEVGIVYSDETPVARKWLCEQVSIATSSHDFSKQQEWKFGGGILNWVRAEAISGAFAGSCGIGLNDIPVLSSEMSLHIDKTATG
jgi:hypothetical protein